MILKFKQFGSEHFDEYKGWFDNERIKSALYDVDKEWLEFVLNDVSGREYAVFSGGELVAVVGIEFPTAEHASYALKNIAVHPGKFGQGIGSEVLKKLLLLNPLKEGENWMAFVEEENRVAQSFFEKNGWNKEIDGSNSDQMIKYIKA